MDINSIFQSKKFKWAMGGIGALVIVLIVFRMGVFVGYRQASFSYRWGENYHKNFGGPPEGFFGMMNEGANGGPGFASPSDTFGPIIKIDGATLVVKDRKNFEKTILTTSSTTINSREGNIKVEDLKVDDKVVVIGPPNDQGQIEAKLIRVFR